MGDQRSKKKSRVFSFRPVSRGTLKDATASLIDDAQGVQRAAERCRVRATSLSNYSNPEEPTSYMPIDVVLQLESSTGAKHVTEYLVAAHGGVFVDLGQLDFNDPNFFKSAAEVMNQAGALCQTIAEGLKDNDFDDSERAAALLEINTLMRSCGGLRVLLNQGQTEQSDD